MTIFCIPNPTQYLNLTSLLTFNKQQIRNLMQKLCITVSVCIYGLWGGKKSSMPDKNVIVGSKIDCCSKVLKWTFFISPYSKLNILALSYVFRTHISDSYLL